MMKLEEKFKQLKKENKKAFIAYFTFGFPELSYTPDIFFALQNAGVDIIEFGFPFSDPLADGPIIQKSSHAALKQQITPDTFFKTIKKMRNNISIPVVIMSYFNPVFKYGLNSFFTKLAENQISGTILVDLPLEESGQYLDLTEKFQIDPVFLITPVTSHKRAKKIIKVTKGFIYYVSVAGITGPKSLNLADISLHIKKIKKMADIPVCVGFGIHNSRQVKQISSFSDGVIVGSEIVKFIDKNYKQKNFLKALEKYVKELKG